jgi:hypothetical protein
MKTYSKLTIAIVLALVFSVVGLSVWAAPLRQGTVPDAGGIVPLTGQVPVTGGTYEVTLLGNCAAVGEVVRITDPLKEIGPAPAGMRYLTDALKVELDVACDLQICYPYPKEYEDAKGDIYKWDETGKEWKVLETTISETPKKICTVEKATKGGVYGLIGN